jgi:hypothetical protein
VPTMPGQHRTGYYVLLICIEPIIAKKHRFGRETVDSASGAASLILTGQGRSVGSLGPGLTSDSADAVRAVLRDDLPAGPQVLWHLPAVPA